jgi:hypothetical protein
MVGIRKYDGGYGKGVMRRTDKGKEPAFPTQRKTASSHSNPLKTRKTKRSPTLEDCAIFKEDEEPRALHLL